MCRLLAIRASTPFDTQEPLARLAEISRNSREYQGHGWGCALRREDGTWSIHKSLSPIWEDDRSGLGSTTLLLAHARSAFRDEGIAIENNMPFHDERHVFIFNGELHGVRIRETGRIGAEKIFNFIMRFAPEGLEAALQRGTTAIGRRSRHVRAMNIVLTDGATIAVSSSFGEDPDYFTMHYREDDDAVTVCSEPWPGTRGWKTIGNGEVRAFP